MIKSNFKITEHQTRYWIRCSLRLIGTAAREFWEGFGKPVLIVAMGVAMSAPLARMAAGILATMMEGMQ